MSKSLALLALVLSTIASPIEPRQSCSDVTVFFARGTGERGSIGTIVGPPFEAALRTALAGRSLDFKGIPYPASIAGFFNGGSLAGAITMANDVSATANACPDTKIVISGYSQGAQVTHRAAARLSRAVQNRVNAAVVFGDPDNGQPFPGPIQAHELTFCAAGDNICAGGILILPPHLSYGADAGKAASFVVSQI
ncbi:Cutinase [Termitomyces sp. T112]|nr:Cutinase [Termitomyces sp. T112]KAH0582360.1 hypothetical protein H2248_010306 [Termitomyces sp. 'cryptogamus']KNZ77277.1 Cutinase [Termitomyces sp. J132]